LLEQIVDFFLDENITPKIALAFKAEGYTISSIHSLKKFGLENGAVINLSINYRAILVTLDKEFLNPNKKSPYGILIIDIHPARDPFTVPVVTEFLQKLKKDPIDWKNKISKNCVGYSSEWGTR